MSTHRLRQTVTVKTTPVHSAECAALRAETRRFRATSPVEDLFGGG